MGISREVPGARCTGADGSYCSPILFGIFFCLRLDSVGAWFLVRGKCVDAHCRRQASEHLGKARCPELPYFANFFPRTKSSVTGSWVELSAFNELADFWHLGKPGCPKTNGFR